MQYDYLAFDPDWPTQSLMAKDKGQYWSGWRDRYTRLSERFYRFRLLPDISTFSRMPRLSFMVRAPFRLEKPYISKDENIFHVLDNPVRRERVFQAPMVAATSWKGALRSAVWQLDRGADKATIRLFGNPRETEDGQAGRLYCYPTFFDRPGLEVINPHVRRTGVGDRPILIESVPRGQGDLLLVYVPFGPIGQGEAEKRTDVAEDLEMLGKAVHATLTTYGFGAKTSSGFGTAADRLAGEGILALRARSSGVAIETGTTADPTAVPDLPRYLESTTRLHADFRRPDGSLKDEEEYMALVIGRGQQYAKRDKLLYSKAKGWWAREGRRSSESAVQEPDTEIPETAPVSTWSYSTLSELFELAQRVAAELRSGGGA